MNTENGPLLSSRIRCRVPLLASASLLPSMILFSLIARPTVRHVSAFHFGASVRWRSSGWVNGMPLWRRSYSQSSYRASSSEALYMAADVEEDAVDASAEGKTIESTWNVPGLKKEVLRLIARNHKKIGKANQRLTKAQQTIDQLVAKDDATVEDLENCPDVGVFQAELAGLKERLQNLNDLEEALIKVGKKKSMVLPPDIAALAISLEVNDTPPSYPRGPGKRKGSREEVKSRKPYRRYYSFQNIEIRVGKRAEDNDELSCSPEHRDASDYWMHASGCPGSHVVIRYDGAVLPEEVVQDAAALAARHSKCTGSTIKVSLTRCRDVKKPPGAKPGLVMLTGKVRTVSVDMKQAEDRLKRLEETVKIN